MEFDDFKVQLVEKIEILTTRHEVNDLVGISTAFDEVPEAKVHADEFLKQSPYNSIRVENVIVLTDVENKEALTQYAEHQRIKTEVSEFEIFLFSEGESFIDAGEFKFELNELFKQIIRLVDAKMEEMNYNSWLQKNNPKDLSNCGHVLLNHERFMYPLYRLDFSTLCETMIDESFDYRRKSLQDVKNIVVNVFSKYLFLPAQKFLRKYSFDCSQTDICELILAMVESGKFNESEDLKASMLCMFNIERKQYTDAVKDIKKRNPAKELGTEAGRARFLFKLYKDLNTRATKKSK